MTGVTPSGMTLLQTLREIVGPHRFFEDPNSLKTYSRDYSFVHPIRPCCVVKPENVEEVQAIVKWANSTHTPLVPVSSGPPRFRGDTVAGVEGVVIVDLAAMKKIIRIDQRNRVAMIEPGVTFDELIPELGKEGLAPFMPLVPRKSKSVVASVLEREPITTPRHHWEAQDPLLCVEVIYGSGDLFRTGSAAGPGTIEEQWEVGRAQVRAMGPGQVDFVKLIQGAQGTMGIVTWATIKCRRLPLIKKAFLVPSENLDHLIDFIYRLMWKKLGSECLILNAHNLASILAKDYESTKVLRESLPPWVLIFAIDGTGLLPQQKVAYQEAEFIEVAQMFGLKPMTVVPGARAEDVLTALSEPSAEPYWKLRFKGGCDDLFFITTFDRSPEFAGKVYNLAGAYRYPVADIGIYVQPTVQGTNCHCEFTFSYDPQSPVETDRVKCFVADSSKILANMGAFFSRPYGHWADIAYGSAAETIIALRKVKDIFDPNHIMNPGKICF
jgi:FAD/FMN-containing dehydrogenase